MKICTATGKKIHKIIVLCWIFSGIVSASMYLRRGRLALVKMPQTRQEAPLDDKEIQQLVDLVEKLIKRVILRIFRTKHICFYRSFVLVSIFRRLGLPVVLNIGMKDLNKATGAAGHCWLSLDGASFFEAGSTMETYSVFLGESRNGMAFWIAKGVPGQENPCSAGENINLRQGAST